jgi:hypothetical protein
MLSSVPHGAAYIVAAAILIGAIGSLAPLVRALGYYRALGRLIPPRREDIADHENIAAAQAAGYKEIVLDRGASYGANRFEITLEKPIAGEPGASGGMRRAYGRGSTQAAAEKQALAALNEQRVHRYGREGGNKGAPTAEASTSTSTRGIA